MNLSDHVKNSLILGANTLTVPDTTFKSLLENCFLVLGGGEELHNLANLYNSKADIIKEFYASLLALAADLVRCNQGKDQATRLLVDLGYSNSRANLFGDFYEKYRRDIEISLVNVGNHPPHVTDVLWKLDHVVKTSNLDEGGGPLFRISLQTERNNGEDSNVNFTCDVQQLQDLVYKLKDATRHCQKIASEH